MRVPCFPQTTTREAGQAVCIQTPYGEHRTRTPSRCHVERQGAEIRSPKPENRRKPEARNPSMARTKWQQPPYRGWGFGLRISDFLRLSGLGFRTSIRHSIVYNRCLGWKDRHVFEIAMKPQAASSLIPPSVPETRHRCRRSAAHRARLRAGSERRGRAEQSHRSSAPSASAIAPWTRCRRSSPSPKSSMSR